jgi:hypothetical protein
MPVWLGMRNHHHHWQNSPFWVVAFVRRFCQIRLVWDHAVFTCLDFATVLFTEQGRQPSVNPEPCLCIYVPQWQGGQITVAAQSKAWTVFARSNTGVVGLNPTRIMDVCVRVFCFCVVLCVGSGLTTGWSPVQGVLPTKYRLRNCKSGQGPKGYRAIDKERERKWQGGPVIPPGTGFPFHRLLRLTRLRCRYSNLHSQGAGMRNW